MDSTNSDDESEAQVQQNDEALLNSEKAKFVQFLRNINRHDYVSGTPYLGGATELDSDAESDPDRGTDSDSAEEEPDLKGETDSNEDEDNGEEDEPDEELVSARPEPKSVQDDQPNTYPLSTSATVSFAIAPTAASAGEPSAPTAAAIAEDEDVNEPPPEFYDPTADESDAQWVEGIRRGYLCRPACLEAAANSVPPGTSTIAPAPPSGPSAQPPAPEATAPNKKLGSKLVRPARSAAARTSAAPDSPAATGPPLPESDARLDCPCCMTTLCYDSQRHELIMSQYRAMFVTSACETDASSTLQCPLEASGAARRGRKRGADERGVESARELLRRLTAADSGTSPQPQAASASDERDLFNPVQCAHCGTRVGVRERTGDRLYHFVNVLASHT